MKRFGLMFAFASPGAFLSGRFDGRVARIWDICVRRRAGLFAPLGGLLACGGQALSLRGARPFQKGEEAMGSEAAG